MKVTITKAAKMAGVSRNTIYNDIEKGVLSYTANARDKKLIDVSELARVYESVSLENDQNEKEEKVLPDVQKRPDVSRNQTKQDISAQVLQTKLEATSQALEKEREERKRERQNFEDQIEKAQNNLEKLQQTHGQTVALLEHRSSSGEGQWDKSIKALEQRVANQEKATKEQKEREAKLLQQNRVLKQRLDEERNKGFWKKLFGSKQPRKRAGG